MKTQLAAAVVGGSSKEAARELVSSVRQQLAGADPALVLAFASTKQPLTDVTSALQEAFPDRVLSASTAGEFAGNDGSNGQTAVFAVAGDYKAFVGIGTNLAQDPQAAVQRAVAAVPESIEGYPHKTAIVFIDSLAWSGEEATLLVAALLGDEVQIAGGAAGDDLAMQSTHVGAGSQAANNAIAVGVLFSKQPLGVGVAHGHKPLSGQLKVTRSEGPRVYELNDGNAWAVWKDAVRKRAKEAWGLDVDTMKDPTDIVQLFARYEGGLDRGDGHYTVRAPLVVNEDGSLNFTSGMPVGTTFRIMETTSDDLVRSAREAAERSCSKLGKRAAGAVVFDCAVRKIVLGSDFGRAIKAINGAIDGPIAGFATYGEIAMNIGELSGFHNSTTVVLTFPE